MLLQPCGPSSRCLGRRLALRPRTPLPTRRTRGCGMSLLVSSLRCHLGESKTPRLPVLCRKQIGGKPRICRHKDPRGTAHNIKTSTED